jgi:hypothetical protein
VLGNPRLLSRKSSTALDRSGSNPQPFAVTQALLELHCATPKRLFVPTQKIKFPMASTFWLVNITVVDFNGKRRCCPHFTPPSLFGRVGGEGHGQGRVKRESLGPAGGLKAPARPRHSADRSPVPTAYAANFAPSGSADSFCYGDGRRPSAKSTAP